MTINSSEDFDPSSTLDFWVLVPWLDDPQERSAWAQEAAGEAAKVRGLDESSVPGIAELLTGLSSGEGSMEGTWQLLFFVQPEFGATVWEVAFVTPDPAVSQQTLVGADVESQLGNHITEFEYNDHAGLQCVRFGLAGDGEEIRPGEQSIEAIAITTLTRDLSGMSTCLVAGTQTAHLESMATSLVAMQYLLASDLFAELVATTHSDPSGNST